ncbi:MAG: hypothetical protein WC637_12265 [Victivallales bacterium]|jgi:hypothetical protein
MSNKIPSSISVNCEKVGREWVVELYFPGVDSESIWIAKDKNKLKALNAAQSKIARIVGRLFKMGAAYGLIGKKNPKSQIDILADKMKTVLMVPTRQWFKLAKSKKVKP